MKHFSHKDIKQRFGENLYKKRKLLQEHHETFQFRGGFRVHWEKSNVMACGLKTFLQLTGQHQKSILNTLNFEVNNIDLTFPKTPSIFKNFKILHLSDIHIDGMLDHGEKLANIIATLNFDLCVITGDFRYLTYGQNINTILYTKKLLQSIPRNIKVIGILGNHDDIDTVPELENLGIQVLLNESTIITKNKFTLGIAGVDDPHFYKTSDIKKSHQNIKHCDIKILLAHSPELIFEANDLSFDYYLCGHTHGGQICLPGRKPIIKNIPSKFHGPYISGAWTYKKLKGYTSRGAGSSGLPARIFCPPEITIHTINPTH